MASKIQVDSLESYDPAEQPIVVSYGATCPDGSVFNVLGNLNVAGIITAANFVGDGSGLTELSIVTKSKAIALTIIG